MIFKLFNLGFLLLIQLLSCLDLFLHLFVEFLKLLISLGLIIQLLLDLTQVLIGLHLLFDCLLEVFLDLGEDLVTQGLLLSLD